MAKIFNTGGICYPDIHYMADTTPISRYIIHTFIDNGEYFTIHRARQYGKTTLLNNLYQELQEEYLVFFISFEELGSAVYISENDFCNAFINLIKDALFFENLQGLSEEVKKEIEDIRPEKAYDLQMLSNLVSRMCLTSSKKVILMIDEVDSASNNQIFMDFLGMLRNKYLQKRRKPTFQSVILAGVYDIKNLKQKIRSDENHKYNSPWNIAADFDADMSFSAEQIQGMLEEYENDHHTGMKLSQISSLLHDYTSGYPYLVSRICKIMDEKVHAWTKEGFLEAVKLLLQESNPLFDDMMKKLEDEPPLKEMLQNILFTGAVYPFNRYDANIQLGEMFGFLKEKHQTVQIANRLFETFLYNAFLSERLTSASIYKAGSMEVVV